jgi:hypothetical protein
VRPVVAVHEARGEGRSDDARPTDGPVGPTGSRALLVALVTGYLGYLATGRYYGVDSVIEKATTVQHAPQLRYVLG